MEKITKDGINEILKDEEFVKKVMSLTNPEDIQSAFKTKNISLSLDEINILKQAIDSYLENGKTELSENDLELISGGDLATALWGLGLSLVALFKIKKSKQL